MKQAADRSFAFLEGQSGLLHGSGNYACSSILQSDQCFVG